jgi:enamine deaminase RidA (YjgF/YER057c/UK114 family)
MVHECAVLKDNRVAGSPVDQVLRTQGGHGFNRSWWRGLMTIEVKTDVYGRMMVSSGSRYEELAGYSRAVVDGHWIMVSGTVGYEVASDAISPDVGEQARQALRNISTALAAVGADLEDVLRIRVFVTESDHVWPVSEVLRATFTGWRPANTTLVIGLAEPALKVELEVTAKRRGRPSA